MIGMPRTIKTNEPYRKGKYIYVPTNEVHTFRDHRGNTYTRPVIYAAKITGKHYDYKGKR